MRKTRPIPKTPKAITGRVIWRLDDRQRRPGTAARDGRARRPSRSPKPGLTLNLMLRRNLDATLPASHTIELIFTTRAGEAGRVVRDVGLLQFKDEEAARGTPVAGLPVPVRENLFLIGLSNLSGDVERNVELLVQPQLDRSAGPAVVAASARILSFEKGASGDQVMQRRLPSSGSRVAARRLPRDGRRKALTRASEPAPRTLEPAPGVQAWSRGAPQLSASLLRRLDLAPGSACTASWIFSKARTSIWRTRSRETPNSVERSSSVIGSSASRRASKMRRSRGLSTVERVAQRGEPVLPLLLRRPAPCSWLGAVVDEPVLPLAFALLAQGRVERGVAAEAAVHVDHVLLVHAELWSRSA